MDELKEFQFQGMDGIHLCGLAWFPEVSPKAIIAIQHGIGDYADRFGRTVEYLLPEGYAVYVADLRGHGKSGGVSQHINRFSDYHDDLSAFLNFIKKDQPGLPIFLFGISLGALIVSEYIECGGQDIKGAVVLGGPYQPAEIASPVKIFTAKLLSGILPTLHIDLGVKPEQYTRDPDIIASDRNDLKFKTVPSVRWGTECLNTVDFVNAHPSDIHVPILVMHGEADRLNAVQGAKTFYNGITFPDKALKVYLGGYHLMYLDLDRKQFFTDLITWMDQHLQPV